MRGQSVRLSPNSSLTERHVADSENLLVHATRTRPASPRAVAGQRPKQSLLPWMRLLLKPANCNISATQVIPPLLLCSRPAPSQFLARAATNNTGLPLSNLQSPPSNPSPVSHQPLPAATNTMAARTLEAGFQRMSIQDENAQGESGRVYQKTSKVSYSLLLLDAV